MQAGSDGEPRRLRWAKPRSPQGGFLFWFWRSGQAGWHGRGNELLALPAVIDLDTANRALMTGRSTGCGFAKQGESPVKVLRLGNAYRVVTADLLKLLGLERQQPGGAGRLKPELTSTAAAHATRSAATQPSACLNCSRLDHTNHMQQGLVESAAIAGGPAHLWDDSPCGGEMAYRSRTSQCCVR